MTREIATLQTSVPPAPQTRVQADMLDAFRSRIETTPAGKCWILAGQEPTGANLTALKNRASELTASRRPLPADKLSRAMQPIIGRLFARWPNTRVDDALVTVAAYATDVAEFPFWAIEAGINALLRGEGLESKSFVPSSLAVRAAVARQVAKADAELREINRVLSAEVIAPTKRTRPEWMQGVVKDTLAALTKAQRNSKSDPARKVEDVIPGETQAEWQARQEADLKDRMSKPVMDLAERIKRENLFGKPYPGLNGPRMEHAAVPMPAEAADEGSMITRGALRPEKPAEEVA